MRAAAVTQNSPPVFLKITPPGRSRGSATLINSILAAVEPFAFVKGFILNIPNSQSLVPHYVLRGPSLTRHVAVSRGHQLRAPTNAAIAAWYERIDCSRHVLIGVGGIASAEDAYETIRLGASLVQLYTALIYKGPGLFRQINEGLRRLIERDGARNIAEIVGVDARKRRMRKGASVHRLVGEFVR